MKNPFLTPLLLLFVTTSVGAESMVPSDGNADADQTKSVVCAGCHGADGNSMVPTFPKLAGQHAPYLLKQLKDFKSATERSNGIMQGQVATLTDEDMQNLAAYFASQKKTIGTAQGSSEVIALGKKIYHGGNAETGVPACMACHGPLGVGNSLAGFPSLAGQHATYTSAQLKSFRSEARKNDAKSMMRTTARMLTDQEIEAVSQYIAGLKP
uniref:Cytochrome c553 n=1 Tax=Candidatus Kentrum sp. FM TaxID=2126340 RepID=A0A450WQ19_9GAMM|nr:MAG: Cytochrome c553 [Candidatus Kentron sp. FM]VFJ73382.1 MAG: Cytochrome c553 [Candidatus Kentron sp. FM]VFK19088.1 MAG: Cytochrome c553 [Candidatus Kentron sp. FM]